MPGASVYLSGTTRGTSVGGRRPVPARGRSAGPLPPRRVDDGLRRRRALHPPGRPATRSGSTLRLAEATATLADVRVEARADRQWQKRLAWFRRTLIGESANADSTRIVNPEVLDFSVRWGTLRATAAAPAGDREPRAGATG